MPDLIPEPPGDDSDTKIVPPPSFQQRLDAARRARDNEIRPSVRVPLPRREPPVNQDDEPTTPAAPVSKR